MSDHLLSGIDAQADHHSPPIPRDRQPSEKKPDSDSIDLFVRHIPQDWDEPVLTQFFEKFGPVYEIIVLRDKVTNQSRGTCFVTFFSRQVALEAQNALNGIKTLPWMNKPVEVSVAYPRRTPVKRRLYVGMLSKTYNERDLREMFAEFGNITSCIIPKDAYGESKGYGFVIFDREQDARNAISAMDKSQTMDGRLSPLVVDYAYSRGEKRIMQQNDIRFNTFNSINFSTSVPNYSPGTSTEIFSNPTCPPYPLNFEPQYGNGELYDMGMQLNDERYMPVPNSLDSPTPGPSFSIFNTDSVFSSSTTPVDPTSYQNLASQASSRKEPGLNTENFAMPATFTSVSSAGQLKKSTNMSVNPVTSVSNSSSVANLPFAVNSQMFINPFGSASNINYDGDFNQFPNSQSIERSKSFPQQNPPHGKRVEGPEGATLSIYHLPTFFTDYDLAQAFQPFGNVISANVCFHKDTLFNICFGFVSYDDPAAALLAIKTMNGMQIGTKRLIVRLKESSKGASKSY